MYARRIMPLLLASALLVNPAPGAPGNKKLTLPEIFDSSRFDGRSISDVQWHPGSARFTFSRKNPATGKRDVFLHEVESGAEELLIAGSSLKYGEQTIPVSSYSWTDDGRHLLVAGKQEQIWRHSTQGPYYLYELATQELRALAGGSAKLRNVKLAPDGKSVGFVRNHNIFVHHLLTGEERRITEDGTPDVLNGEFDWVYEEEFGLADAWRWSPDGSRIAFWQIDQSRVKSFNLVDELPLYNTVTKLKYPKVGEQNALVKIGIADLKTGKITWVDIGENEDIYIPRIYWADSGQLAVLRLNRLQNHLELLLADAHTGAGKTIIEDENSTWIDVEQDLFFLREKKQVVWLSERSGFKHAYLYDFAGNLQNQVTSGDWEISALAGVDDVNQWLYFYGKKDSPIEQNVYRSQFDGSKIERVSQRTGWHTGSFSPDFKHVVGVFSDINTPTQVMLRKTDGTLVRFLEKNNIAALQDYDLPPVEFFSFKTSDNELLNSYMIKPLDFDAGKKYPVIVYGYGGPGSQTVKNQWGMGSRPYHFKQRILWQQMMTEKGFIIFCVDNRGTGGRGKAFKDVCYEDVGKWAVNDQVEGAKYLRSLPYVDGERIGFWGWSGGGYLALMLMTRADEYFKVGISIAPVSDFRFYDTIWTERYMGLPSKNTQGYRDGNVLTYLDNLKGKLLLVHGTGDDNVHVQNAMHVANELQNRGLQFDMMFYPNRNHRISGGKTQLHLFTKMTDYFLSHL